MGHRGSSTEDDPSKSTPQPTFATSDKYATDDLLTTRLPICDQNNEPGNEQDKIFEGITSSSI